MHNTACIILAAGASSRLGTPKQLLAYNNKPLLQHVAHEASRAGLAPIIIVTGFEATRMAAAVAGENVVMVNNPRWQTGMSTGIVAAVETVLKKYHQAEGLIITVCDQPYISAELFKQMMNTQISSAKAVVACSYANTVGVPVLFTAKYFNSLLALSGEEGAKKLIKQFDDDLAVVAFKGGEIDVDTMEDYHRLMMPSAEIK